jgi:hypothetical protein
LRRCCSTANQTQPAKVTALFMRNGGPAAGCMATNSLLDCGGGKPQLHADAAITADDPR